MYPERDLTFLFTTSNSISVDDQFQMFSEASLRSKANLRRLFRETQMQDIRNSLNLKKKKKSLIWSCGVSMGQQLQEIRKQGGLTNLFIAQERLHITERSRKEQKYEKHSRVTRDKQTR